MKFLFNQWLWSIAVVALLAYSYLMLNRTFVGSYNLTLNQAAVVTPVLEVGKKYELIIVNKLTAKVGADHVEADALRYLNANGIWVTHDWLKINEAHIDPELAEFDLYRYSFPFEGVGEAIRVSFSSFNGQQVSGKIVAALYER